MISATKSKRLLGTTKERGKKMDKFVEFFWLIVMWLIVALLAVEAAKMYHEVKKDEVAAREYYEQGRYELAHYGITLK